ncbi:MAG: ATP-dependent DNA helicase [Caulobacterales bacterium]
MTRLLDPADQAREALNDGAPVVLLTGRAGTGKSWFIKALSKENTVSQVVLAPTGLAAMNIGGQTVHSFFGFPPRPLIGFSEKPNWFFTKAARGVQRIVVDEVSMLRADVLDAMDSHLRAAKRSSRPFGGVQMLLVGDFHQLPPVVRQGEAQMLEEAGYPSPFAFSAHVLRDADVTAVELTEVRRQTDQDFIDLLARIRDNRDVERALEDLNRRCVGATLSQPPVLLAATNAVADAYNRRGLEALSGEARVYAGAFKGEKAPKEAPPGDRLPAPAQLMLRRGARVIFTQNDPEGRWVNGSLGKVMDFDADRVTVLLDAATEPVEVARARWPQTRWVWSDDAKALVPKEEYGYEQFPLAHAWAITIHKAQGMTLDSVEIDLGRGAFAAGQTYVALSRARSMEGLRLTRALQPRDVQLDPAIEEGLGRFH